MRNSRYIIDLADFMAREIVGYESAAISRQYTHLSTGRQAQRHAAVAGCDKWLIHGRRKGFDREHCVHLKSVTSLFCAGFSSRADASEVLSARFPSLYASRYAFTSGVLRRFLIHRRFSGLWLFWGNDENGNYGVRTYWVNDGP